MRSFCLFILAVAANAVLVAEPKSKIDETSISATLEPEQAEICIGEPAFVRFVVHNGSDRNLEFSIGGDYQNGLGRPDSFTVTVYDAASVAIPKREAFDSMGGMMGREKLPAHGEYAFRLFIPHWAIITEPGDYTIFAGRTLNFIEDDFKKTADVKVDATAPLRVAPRDQAKLDRLIDALGKKISTRGGYDERDAWNQMKEVANARAVPYLLEALRLRDYSAKFEALDCLALVNTDEALEGLKLGMKTTGDDFNSSGTADGLRDNIHHAAAVGLSKSPHPAALTWLIEQRHEVSMGVRLTAVHAMRQKLDPKEAIPLLREMSRDDDKMVSGEAKRHLKELGAEP